jgi:hypothetical protein
VCAVMASRWCCQNVDKGAYPVSRRHQRIFISIGHELLGLFLKRHLDQALVFGILDVCASVSPLHPLPPRLLRREDSILITVYSDCSRSRDRHLTTSPSPWCIPLEPSPCLRSCTCDPPQIEASGVLTCLQQSQQSLHRLPRRPA